MRDQLSFSHVRLLAGSHVADKKPRPAQVRERCLRHAVSSPEAKTPPDNRPSRRANCELVRRANSARKGRCILPARSAIADRCAGAGAWPALGAGVLRGRSRVLSLKGTGLDELRLTDDEVIINVGANAALCVRAAEAERCRSGRIAAVQSNRTVPENGWITLSLAQLELPLITRRTLRLV